MNHLAIRRSVLATGLLLSLVACGSAPDSGEAHDIAGADELSSTKMPPGLPIASAVATTSDDNVASNAIDGSLATRWSGEGSGASITFTLEEEALLTSVSVAWYRASERTTSFSILASQDGTNFTTVVPKRSSTKGDAVETYAFTATAAKYVKIVGYGSSENDWNSIDEVSIAGTSLTTSDAGTTHDAGTDSGTSPTKDAGAIQYPAQLLDLTNWKITLPIDSKGGTTGTAEEITQPELATFAIDPWFTLNATKTAIQFRANHGGATTSGSGNPRSELREMIAGGTEEASWSSTVGTSTLWIKEAITHLTNTKPQTVAGQIHDANNDITVFRLEGSNLYITDGNNTHAHLLTSTYVLGTIITVKFIVSGGVITYEFNDAPVTGYSQNKVGSGWFFKVGDYTQSNPSTANDSDAAYAEVQVYDFQVTHD